MLDSSGAKGFLVIDRTIRGASWGGLRIITDASMEETSAAAHTMTLKYGFIGLPVGGAKASLQLENESPSHRRQALRELGGKVSPLLRSERWMPGIDMGCTVGDITDLYRGAGMPMDLTAWKDLSATYTAWTLYYATLAALENRGEQCAGKTFVIQGFGKVGIAYSTLMANAGARLIGLSNRIGAIVSTAGIDVKKASHHQVQMGDAFIADVTNATHIDPDTLFAQKADIIVPCARAWAIHEKNWNHITASIILCAANCAIEPEVQKYLFKAGKVVIPDFIANCGGVFGSYCDRYLTRDDIRQFLESTYRERVGRILRESKRTMRSPEEIGSEIALQRILFLDGTPEHRLERFGRSILPFIPDLVRRPSLREYCRRTYFDF